MPCKLPALLCLFLVIGSCNKNNTQTDNSTTPVDIGIVNTATAASQTQQSGIVSQVRCMQRNTCEKFTGFDIRKAGATEYEIRAKGTVPNPAAGDIFCGQIVTYKDTTVVISAAVKGQYLLHFYNQAQLFKTDTVQVN